MDSVSDKFFLEARDMFLQKLPHPERLIFANCKGPEELLADVRKLGHFRTKNQAWIRILEKIKSFSDNIEPYFKIVEVVISSHPESAAIAWGAIRLVLQVTGFPFVSFFNSFHFLQ